MTIMVLLVFMAISQVAVAAYLLYMFNDVEREARKRNAEFRAYLDASLNALEQRLSGRSERARPRPGASAVG
jgi:hypothetical protein